VLASHDRAAQVDRADAVEGLLGQFVQRLIATPDADPDIAAVSSAGRTAVPDPLTKALPGPNDYSDLAFETHGSTPCNRVFKDASMVHPFASQPGRSDYLPIASFILDAPA
jgi:hypothetical protein